jgi:hypothetical protein
MLIRLVRYSIFQKGVQSDDGGIQGICGAPA